MSDRATRKVKQSWSGHSFVPAELEYRANYSLPKLKEKKMSETFAVRLDRFMRLSSTHHMREYGMELAAEGTVLEAKLRAMTVYADKLAKELTEAKLERSIRRITLHGGVVGDYDGAYDWIKKDKESLPENSVGYHEGSWSEEGWTVIEVIVIMPTQQEQEEG